MKYDIKKEDTLLEFLYKNINKSKNTIKNILKNGNIIINGKVVTKYDYRLNIGDILEIKKMINNIEIIYEDKYIIVVNKRSKLPTIADNKNKENNLYHMVSSYLKQKNKNSKVFIIHRLDKDTSGVIMFAKSETVKKIYQDDWNNITLLREYIAIVEGRLKKREGTIKNSLSENNEGYVYINSNGKLAITSYEVIKENNNLSLLKVNIKTGKKNQIRVALKSIGNPIIGDLKYGSKSNPINRLGLHASRIEVIDPITKKRLVFEAKVPECFEKLF